jgi:hypothetical protein
MCDGNAHDERYVQIIYLQSSIHFFTPRHARTQQPTKDERQQLVKHVHCQIAPLNRPIQFDVACSDVRQYQSYLIGRIIENMLSGIFR